jgi:NTP pyrophosphatase (non-canonical NTP hydrolase)
MSYTKMSYTLNRYQQDASRTGGTGLAVSGLGIAGEAGEVADLIKKYIGHGHALSIDDLEKELGDVLWYVADLASQVGLTLEEVAAANIEKLRKRYPNGFSQEASQNRSDR